MMTDEQKKSLAEAVAEMMRIATVEVEVDDYDVDKEEWVTITQEQLNGDCGQVVVYDRDTERFERVPACEVGAQQEEVVDMNDLFDYLEYADEAAAIADPAATGEDYVRCSAEMIAEQLNI